MIDKIYILNEKEEVERKEKCRELLLEQGVPKSRIRLFKAKSHRGFEKSRDLCEAAAAEGFTFFDEYLKHGYHNTAQIAYLGMTWSYLSFCQHIVDTQETSMFIADDICFNFTWKEFKKSLQDIPAQPVFQFGILQTKEILFDDYEYLSDDSHWIKGTSIFMHDWALVFTPEFASKLLNDPPPITEYAYGDGVLFNGRLGEWINTLAGGVYTLMLSPCLDTSEVHKIRSQAIPSFKVREELNVQGFSDADIMNGSYNEHIRFDNKGDYISPIQEYGASSTIICRDPENDEYRYYRPIDKTKDSND